MDEHGEQFNVFLPFSLNLFWISRWDHIPTDRRPTRIFRFRFAKARKRKSVTITKQWENRCSVWNSSSQDSISSSEVSFISWPNHNRTTISANTKKTVVCQKKLTETDYKTLLYAIQNSYYYQMYLDDMPIWGMVGEIDNTVSPPAYKLYTHKRLDIGFNDKQVVDVNLTTDGRVDIRPGAEITYTYEVQWSKSEIDFSKRFDKYLDPNFFQHRVKTRIVVLWIKNLYFRFTGSQSSTASWWSCSSSDSCGWFSCARWERITPATKRKTVSTILTQIWETNTDGNRFTETSSDHHPCHCFFHRASELDITSSLLQSSPPSWPLLESSIPSMYTACSLVLHYLSL